SGSFFDVGTTQVTVTATDGAGNTDQCTFDVVVNDTENPTANCPTTQTVGSTAGQCGANVSFTIPNPTDNCTGASSAANPASGSFFDVGTTQVTVTATDGAGNTDQCTFDVVVNDTEDPTVNCPGNVTQLVDMGQSYATVMNIAPTSSNDNCMVTSTTHSISGATTAMNVSGDASGTQFNIGSSIVTYTVSDAAGNTGQCSFNVNINGDAEISIEDPDNNSMASGISNYDFGNVNIMGGSASGIFTITNLGDVNLLLNGNPDAIAISGSSSFSVTQPALTTIAPAGNTTFQVSYNPANDDCSEQTATISIANNDPDEDPFTFTVTATPVDNIVPVVSGSLMEVDVEGCSTADAPAAYADVAALENAGLSISDNCSSDANMTVQVSAATNGTCPIVMTRTYTVTDEAGNVSASFTQTINIDDNTAPSVSGTLADTDVSGCSTDDAPNPHLDVAALENAGMTISDACTSDANLTVNISVAVNGSCPIVMTRTYTVEDECGNVSASFTHVINIDDTTAPFVSGTIADTDVEGCSTDDVPAPYTSVAALENVGMTIGDNCISDDNLTVNVSVATNGTCPIVMTRTYTVEDDCGNVSASFTHVINIDDMTAPAVSGTLAETDVEGCSTADAPAPYADVAALENAGMTISDACTSDANLTVNVSAVTNGTCPIVMTRTYTVEDECGNISASFTHVINIDDNTAPAVSGTLADTNVEGCSTADAPAPYADVAALENAGMTISDACTSDANLTVNVSAATNGTCPIVMTRTYTVEDECGNISASFTHVINIDDNTAPAVSGTLAETDVEGCSTADAPAPYANVAALENAGMTISDACTSDANLTVNVSAVTNGTCPIVMTRTYTVEDECGNISTSFTHVINIDDNTAPAVSGTLADTNVEGC
ncbi:MAG: HYR domain-containing protein, partial [Chitinophagales bacterium]|nr:HYR domain-containing protein [Chitinophagales bacterium]